jgi:hypothetical protein
VALRSRSRRVDWTALLAAELAEVVGANGVEIEEPLAVPLAS